LRGAINLIRRCSMLTGPDGAMLHLSSLLMAVPDMPLLWDCHCTKWSAILIH